MHGIYTNIGGKLMVNVTIYTIHGSYGMELQESSVEYSGPERALCGKLAWQGAWVGGGGRWDCGGSSKKHQKSESYVIR